MSYEKVEQLNSENQACAEFEPTFDWSLEEEEIFEKASICSRNSVDRQSKLWSSVFAPRSKKEFFGNVMEVEKFYSWLETWKKRFLWQMKSKSGENRRRKKISMCDGSEYLEKNTTNPFVIVGPCGSGKTSTVYCAAKENNIRIIELSSGDKRNGAVLEEKLVGAIKNHYVNKQRKISSMFSVRSTHSFNPMIISVDSLSLSFDFSLVLIDDCDIIYSNDERFWSALKDLCEESKIPIVLTCSDPVYVEEMLHRNSSVMYESIHFKLPSSTLLAKHLRPWVCGYSNNLLTISWLKSVIAKYRCDVRAILNAIQYSLSSESPNEDARRLVDLVPLKTHLGQISMLSNLDAAYGRTPSTTWRAKLSMDLDFVPESVCYHQKWMRGSAEFEEPVQLILQPYFQDMYLVNFTSIGDSQFQPNSPVRDAWQRSSTMLYSCSDVSLDYLPALCALDNRYYKKMCGMRNQRTKNTRCRVQHPFDAVCHKLGLPIDINQRLKHSISKYSFSA